MLPNKTATDLESQPPCWRSRCQDRGLGQVGRWRGVIRRELVARAGIEGWGKIIIIKSVKSPQKSIFLLLQKNGTFSNHVTTQSHVTTHHIFRQVLSLPSLGLRDVAALFFVLNIIIRKSARFTVSRDALSWRRRGGGEGGGGVL